MTVEMAVDILRQLISTSIMLIAPIMTTAISVGIFVSLFQSVTSIQEQTLTFVPKLLAVGGVVLASANWMVKTLVEFTAGYITRMADMSL